MCGAEILLTVLVITAISMVTAPIFRATLDIYIELDIAAAIIAGCICGLVLVPLVLMAIDLHLVVISFGIGLIIATVVGPWVELRPLIRGIVNAFGFLCVAGGIFVFSMFFPKQHVEMVARGLKLFTEPITRIASVLGDLC